jgi:hypothetical protein
MIDYRSKSDLQIVLTSLKNKNETASAQPKTIGYLTNHSF